MMPIIRNVGKGRLEKKSHKEKDEESSDSRDGYRFSPASTLLPLDTRPYSRVMKYV